MRRRGLGLVSFQRPHRTIYLTKAVQNRPVDKKYPGLLGYFQRFLDVERSLTSHPQDPSCFELLGSDELTRRVDDHFVIIDGLLVMRGIRRRFCRCRRSESKLSTFEYRGEF